MNQVQKFADEMKIPFVGIRYSCLDQEVKAFVLDEESKKLVPELEEKQKKEGKKLPDFINIIIGIFIYLSGIFSGFIINRLTQEPFALEKCIKTFYLLKNELEKLALNITNSNRATDYDYKSLITIKNIIEQLDTEKSGLLFQYPPLKDLIARSYPLFDKLRTMDDEYPLNKPNIIALNLIDLWGFKDFHLNQYKSSSLLKIQTFFHATTIKRIFMKIKNLKGN